MHRTDPEIPHILLVDDNYQGLLARSGVLQELGFCVATANCGESALNLFLAEKFDLVITDYRMPGMSGTELIDRIRSHDPFAKVVLISGFAEPLGLNEENTGADAVIAKSNREVVQLTRAVTRLISRRTPRKPPSRQKSAPLVAKIRSV